MRRRRGRHRHPGGMALTISHPTVRSAAHARDRRGGLGTWLAENLAAERDRWALWLPVAFAAGIAIYFGLAAEPPSWLGLAGAAGAVGLYLVLRAAPNGAVLSLLAAALAAGFVVAQARTALVEAPVLAKRLGPVWVSGQVEALEPRTKGARLTLRHLAIARLDPAQTPDRARVTARVVAPELKPGDWVRLRAVLRPPPGPSAPGAFDFARQAYFQGLGGVGFAYGAVRPGPSPSAPATEAARSPSFGARWAQYWAGLRANLARRILDQLPGRSGAIAAALMTGERGAIAEADMAAMRDSGLAHLLAISGLHVGLVAGLLFLGLRLILATIPRLALDYPIKKWAAVAAVCGAFAYLMLTGAPIPTQRAFLMVALVFLAVLLDRDALSMRLVAWAAFAVLALAPESLLSASFQMSFAAVMALIAGYEALRGRRPFWFAERGPLTRAGLYLAGVAGTSLIAGLATAPFALYHFNRIAWFGLAANMVAVPLTALWIMPWALVAFCLMPFGAEGFALRPMGWGIEAMLGVAHAVAGWPGAISAVPAMPTAGLVAVALGGVWLCLWRRPWRLAGGAAILAGLLSIPLNTPPDILVTGDGGLLGLRAPEGDLVLSSASRQRFSAEIWRRRLGEAEAEAWPPVGASLDGRLTCDRLGCIYRAPGHIVALVTDARALHDDCAVATVVVSRVPVRRGQCPGAFRVIDRFDLWRGGAHALWLADGGVRVESAAARRGDRPWVPRRGR